MILNDFIQPKLKFSREKLDAVLVELCSMVIEGQQDNPDFYGMVAAAVLDPRGRLATGVNYLYGNERIHAERAAIDKYEEEYGELPKGSIVITTLSPCCEDTHDNRYGVSCTDLLNEKHIKLAYCGYSDPSQDNTQEKFTIIITENSKIKLLCEKLANTFLKKNLNEAVESNKAQEFISNVYSQYPDWPYGQADKVMVWGEGEAQQFAAFKLKPSASPDTVEIDWIMAGPEQRKGVGSRAIKELQRLAQADGIKLTLYPWSKGRISQSSLAKLYKRHGFRPVAKGAKPMTWEPVNEESNKQILSYIKKIHPKGEFTIDHAVMNHAEWELTNVPLSSLHIESDEVSPYDQINYIDYDHVADITAQDIKANPIVVDVNGWIIDGNHRAVAARDIGMKSIPAYIPVESDDNEETYNQHMARIKGNVSENFADGYVGPAYVAVSTK
jgi:pyrimidine deaminase RibD-like protein